MMGLVDGIILLFRIFLSYIKAVYKKISPPTPKDISRELVLVTGAGHGMGRLEAIEFAKSGATVIVVDINEDENVETADQIREMGGKVYAYTCDLSKKENVKRLAADVRRDVGDVSILVNNAGIVYAADILSLTDEKTERTFNVNVLSHFWTIREFLPAMKQKNHGHIVALASMAGVNGLPYLTDYCSSKFAVVGLYEALSRELRWQKMSGVHTTCVCPTFVDTGFMKNPKMRSAQPVKPEVVVDRIMDGVRYNRRLVYVPEERRAGYFIRWLLPDEAFEKMFDWIDPRFDLVDMKKE